MKKLIILIVVTLFTTSGLFAQKTPFEKFDKNRIDVGTLYVYEYSDNEKGFEPSTKEYLYIKTLNDIETMDIDTEDTLELPDIVNYTLNWNYMMLEKIHFKTLKNKKNLKNGYSFESTQSIDFLKKIFKDDTYGKEKNELQHFHNIFKLESIPTYFYGYTDLMPLWFALRFYPLNKKMITVNSNTRGYNTKFEIKYEGKEKVKVPFGKILSYKFELVPKLSFLMKLFHSPKKAFIWLSAKSNYRYMVKYKNDNAQDSETPLIEYRLIKREKMTSEEWEQFKKKHIAERLKKTRISRISTN